MNAELGAYIDCHCERPTGAPSRGTSLAALRQFTFWQSEDCLHTPHPPHFVRHRPLKGEGLCGAQYPCPPSLRGVTCAAGRGVLSSISLYRYSIKCGHCSNPQSALRAASPLKKGARDCQGLQASLRLAKSRALRGCSLACACGRDRDDKHGKNCHLNPSAEPTLQLSTFNFSFLKTIPSAFLPRLRPSAGRRRRGGS